MQEKLQGILLKAKRIADKISDTPGTVRVISHYDADGIASAAIMVKALSRAGKDFHLTIIKQLSEEIVQELAKESPKIVAFLDLGSGHLDSIQSFLKDSVVVIADHHQVQGTEVSRNLFHLNPVNFGIEEDVSGSGTTYLLARVMGSENKDLSELGIIGAIGDSQVGSIGPEWGLSGLNKEILTDAVNTGKMRVQKGLRLWGRYTRPIHKALEYSMDPAIPGVSGSESGAVQFLQELKIELKREDGSWRTLGDLSPEEQQKLASGIIAERIRDNHENPEWIFGDVYDLLEREHKDASEFATILNATGKMKKEYLGVALCLNMPEASEEVKGVLESYRREIGKALAWLKANSKVVRSTENAHYVIAGDRISEHIISNVVSILNRSDFFVEDKPVFAMVITEDSKLKVSARASDRLVGEGLNLKEMVAEVVEPLRGEGGGHSGAAGATIPLSSEQAFIDGIEASLKRLKQEKEGERPEEINKKEAKKDIKTETKEKDYGGKKGAGDKGAKEVSGKVGKKVEGKGLVRYLGS